MGRAAVLQAGFVPWALAILVSTGTATGSLLQVSVGRRALLHGCVLVRGLGALVCGSLHEGVGMSQVPARWYHETGLSH